jgi:elongator complex protein 3
LETHYRWIVDRLLEFKSPTRKDLTKIKIKAAKEFSLEKLPGNAEILAVLSHNERQRLLPILKRKIMRGMSGVSVIAVMTEPFACPHGRCAYCPGGPEENTPQSYTGKEPAAMRGAQNRYDPYMQVMNRIGQLKAIGHDVDKTDLIIMGGTFPSTPKNYQKWFVKGCLDALNGIRSKNLVEAKEKAEKANIRNIGLTIETRPDCINYKEVDRLLNLFTLS